MKLKKNNAVLAALAALVLPQIASASLLVGFHNFDGTATTETVGPSQTALPSGANNYASAGFLGTLTKNGEVSVNGGGSNDGTYGDRNFGLANPTNADGYGRSLGGGDPIFKVTNLSGSAVTLSSLLFDAATQAGGGTIKVTYVMSTGESGNFTTNKPLPTAGGSGSNINFEDFAVSLAGWVLGDEEWIEFKFDGSPNGRIDNLALTAIPEPGSMLGLGCVVGAGAFLRSRRRRA